MTFTQLRYFVTVAHLENISQAARLLRLSQSSLSKSIAKIESELGAYLFQRSGKKIILTPQGERFLEFCTTILQEMDQVTNEINLMMSGTDNKVKIGIAGCADTVINCASEFKKEHPDADFEFVFEIETLENIDINEYDILVYPHGFKYDKLVGHPLSEERYLLAVPRSHPLSVRPIITAANLVDQDFVFFRKGKFFIEFPYHVCTALNIPCRSQCFCDDRQSHVQIIASGMAVGFVASGFASVYAHPDIQLIPIENKRFSRPMMICFRRNKRLSPMAQRFRDFLVDKLDLPNPEDGDHPVPAAAAAGEEDEKD
ncbi:MAG: LysR family transcriptional regulator [Clostridia bacterium]|nr:LysR family transcriptional regulator [Clostridia bacterium]